MAYPRFNSIGSGVNVGVGVSNGVNVVTDVGLGVNIDVV